MRVMSGFRKQETRFVATEHVDFPALCQKQYLTDGLNFLIPHYQRYVDEYNSEDGDHGEAARKMLFHIIPYLVETVLQCGFYFIRDYPEHPLSNLLKVSTIQ